MAARPSVRIAGAIRRRITTGELRPGDRVPSTRQIAREWGVAIATATRVLATLRQEGLVVAVPGVGTVVSGSGVPVRAAAESRRPLTAGYDLSREVVVGTAIGIADGEGLAALSMRRLAAALHVPTMSLYRHVRAKDELVLLMIDSAFGEEPLPDPPPRGWRAQLEIAARIQWRLYKKHPWLAPLISMTRPQVLPNGVRHTEWALRAVDGLGLDVNTRLHVAVALLSLVRGAATNLEAEVEAQVDTGLDSEEWMRLHEAEMAEAFATGPYPHLERVTSHPEADMDLDSLFEFGLGRFLDGVESLIRARI
jgi:DNA-binding transcriptional regulator YhcF (GntR family)